MGKNFDSKEIILNVENLNTTFVSDQKKIRIVKNVSFQLKRGKALAVVGESGCGKSVTMNSIMRFLGRNAIIKADSIQYNALRDGKVTEYHIEKIDKPHGPEMRALRGPEMSMVFQDPMSSLNPVYKVGDQVAEGLLQHNKGMTKAQAREKVLEMFRKLGIPDPEERIDCYPHQFSGGMKQRVVIAIAMICNPELIICDEPTTALDVTIQNQILRLLSELNQKLGMAILLITHDLSVMAQICHSVRVMYLGQIVEEAKTEELFDNPMHPYTRGLLDCIPHLDVDREKPLHVITGTVPPLSQIPVGCHFCTRCPYATEQCRKNEPPAVETSPGHRVKCWNMPYERTAS